MKKKTVYNIIMFAVIGVIAAGAVFFAGRHLGWFDRPAEGGETVAVTAAVRKGLATLTRSGLATELSGETALRPGDQITVTSGSSSVRVGDSEVLLSQDGTLELVSAEKKSAQVRLVRGEAFCQAAEDAVTLLYGDHSAKMQSSTLVCTVRDGSETLYVLGGEVAGESDVLTAGQIASFVGADRSVQKLELQALSSFALECVLSCEAPLFCSREQAQSVLEERTAVPTPGQEPETGNAPPAPTQQPAESTAPAGPAQKSDESSTSSEPTQQPAESKPSQAEQPTRSTCTIEIRCDTILSNMGDLEAGLDVYVPDSGAILPATTVSFDPGETVFDVLKRICDERNIQIEYSFTPLYNSYYIEGINHLYEFSCGPESGWMYKVNGWFPNYGCSAYKLRGGESIVWCYTCHGLGTDVGAPKMG